MQGDTKHARASSPPSLDTDEASSHEMLCATHNLAPPFRGPCGRQRKGISIWNNNEADQSTVALVSHTVC